MSLADRFRRWYDYEREVHALALASFDTIPGAARTENDFHRAVDLMAHLAVARRLWLFRIGGLAEGPADLFPRGMTLEQVRKLHAETESAPSSSATPPTTAARWRCWCAGWAGPPRSPTSSSGAGSP